MKSLSVTIQIRTTEQNFPVELFIMLYKVVLPLSLWMKSYGVTIQMKATEQYFPVVLFIMLYKVVLTFESVDEILQSVTIQMKATEQPFPVVLFIMLYKVVRTFESVDDILVWPLKWKLLRSTFTWYYSICFSTLNKMKFGNFVEFWLSCGDCLTPCYDG